MPRLSIVLPDEEHQALCDLALRQWREPREQAGFMIAEALERAGALPPAEQTAAQPAERAS